METKSHYLIFEGKNLIKDSLELRSEIDPIHYLDLIEVIPKFDFNIKSIEEYLQNSNIFNLKMDIVRIDQKFKIVNILIKEKPPLDLIVNYFLLYNEIEELNEKYKNNFIENFSNLEEILKIICELYPTSEFNTYKSLISDQLEEIKIFEKSLKNYISGFRTYYANPNIKLNQEVFNRKNIEIIQEVGSLYNENVNWLEKNLITLILKNSVRFISTDFSKNYIKIQHRNEKPKKVIEIEIMESKAFFKIQNNIPLDAFFTARDTIIYNILKNYIDIDVKFEKNKITIKTKLSNAIKYS
ncbi:hypothetical protein [Algoriphagus algorifonticola]|uniref:hypothetical protein n=1 Tax=Algoriphagus algorifonticola TaxID=2593007 RepID=UPI0011A1CDB5|nr:hypothetical protein [Algoriphagus algorifonticola]